MELERFLSLIRASDWREVWPWLSLAFAFAGLLINLARKSLASFSRKGLLERLPSAVHERYRGYFDRLDEYQGSLRMLDHAVRIPLLVSVVLALKIPAAVGDQGSAAQLGAVAIAVVVIVAVVVIGLEFTPALIARLSPEGLLISLLPVIDRAYRFTALLLRLFESLVSAGARALGSPPEREPAEIVEEEILTAAEEGEREGILKGSEVDMIEAIIRFRDREVSEILTPRTEVVAIEESTPIEECARIASACGHSRIPVYRENKDQIVGILYAKDLLRLLESGGDPPRLADLLRKPRFVPETKKVSELLQEFRSQRFHMAMVLDEFGGTCGVVTIEDVIEEILGDIEEEGGRETPPRGERLVRLGSHRFSFEARFPVDELNRYLQEQFGGGAEAAIPEEDHFETVGGFLASSLGKIPSAGETYRHGRLQFEVLEADERSIKRVGLRIEPSGAEAASG